MRRKMEWLFAWNDARMRSWCHRRRCSALLLRKHINGSHQPHGNNNDSNLIFCLRSMHIASPPRKYDVRQQSINTHGNISNGRKSVKQMRHRAQIEFLKSTNDNGLISQPENWRAPAVRRGGGHECRFQFPHFNLPSLASHPMRNFCRLSLRLSRRFRSWSIFADIGIARDTYRHQNVRRTDKTWHLFTPNRKSEIRSKTDRIDIDSVVHELEVWTRSVDARIQWHSRSSYVKCELGVEKLIK